MRDGRRRRRGWSSRIRAADRGEAGGGRRHDAAPGDVADDRDGGAARASQTGRGDARGACDRRCAAHRHRRGGGCAGDRAEVRRGRAAAGDTDCGVALAGSARAVCDVGAAHSGKIREGAGRGEAAPGHGGGVRAGGALVGERGSGVLRGQSPASVHGAAGGAQGVADAGQAGAAGRDGLLRPRRGRAASDAHGRALARLADGLAATDRAAAAHGTGQ